jgi:hypothetical protein
MPALLGDGRGEAAEAEVVGDEDVGGLALERARPSHQAADGLAEEEIGDGVGRVDADAQAGDVDTLGDHANGDDPGRVAGGEVGDPLRGRRIVRRRHGRRDAQVLAQDPRDAAGVVLIHGDDQAGGRRVPQAQV